MSQKNNTNMLRRLMSRLPTDQHVVLDFTQPSANGVQAPRQSITLDQLLSRSASQSAAHAAHSATGIPQNWSKKLLSTHAAAFQQYMDSLAGSSSAASASPAHVYSAPPVPSAFVRVSRGQSRPTLISLPRTSTPSSSRRRTYTPVMVPSQSKKLRNLNHRLSRKYSHGFSPRQVVAHNLLKRHSSGLNTTEIVKKKKNPTGKSPLSPRKTRKTRR